MRKCLYTAIMLCMVIAADAQLMLDDSLQTILRPYRNKGIDTIITFTIHTTGGMAARDTLNGLGEMFVLESAWLFYKKNNQLVTIKYCLTLEHRYANSAYAQSEELVCDDPAPINWIIQHDSLIATNRILPHIIRFEHNNAMVYDHMRSFHPTTYYIGIHVSNSSHYLSVDGEALSQRWRDGMPANINYEHNINSEINQALQKLLLYREEYDKRYFFMPGPEKNHN